MTFQDQVMSAYHDYRFVAVSVLVSIIAAYAARDLTERVREARGRTWVAWLVAAAIGDGIGTWSMHYTGKLALRLPVPFQFDWPTVLLSLLVSIIGSAGALLVLSHSKIGWSRALAASIFMGGMGISGLHYTGMAAMRFQGTHHHSLPLASVAIILAILFSWMSLTLTFIFPEYGVHRSLRHHGGALLRGAANPVMHYTAMAAVIWTYSSQPLDLSYAVSISSLGILGISIVPGMVLIVALMTSIVDRLQKQGAYLNELFEQAPQAVVLMSMDNRIVRVNREFTRLFGYTPEETIGRRLNELIVPDEFQEEYQRYAEMVALGQRVDVEGVRQRKGGNYIHVSIVHVPVSLPGGHVERYAIFRDITERKQAEAEQERLFDEVSQSHGQLKTLSSRLVEVEESERKRLAREIHDDISQSLTALMMQLSTARSRLPQSSKMVRSILEETETLTQRTLERTRLMIADLRPPVLDDLGLVPALRRLGDELQEGMGVIVTLKTSHLPKRLPPQIEVALFRIVQEALTNIRRHAQARHVTVELTKVPGRVMLLVRDDGIGFKNDALPSRQSENKGATEGFEIPPGHFGLIGIQERVNLLDGRFELTSAPDQGTTIRVDLPLQE